MIDQQAITDVLGRWAEDRFFLRRSQLERQRLERRAVLALILRVFGVSNG